MSGRLFNCLFEFALPPEVKGSNKMFSTSAISDHKSSYTVLCVPWRFFPSRL